MNRGLNGRIMELNLDRQPVWQFDGLQYPVDAQVIGNNRVLVVEYTLRRVTERDFEGKILWEKNLTDRPTGVQRLPGGQLLIICQRSLIEVDREGREGRTWPTPSTLIVGARKSRDGQMVVLTSDGILHRLDAAGKLVKRFAVGGSLNTFTGIDVLPNGRVLVPIMGQGKIVELDADGRTMWEASVPRPTAVTRLPGGNTLVTSLPGQRVVEIDRQGNTVWEYSGSARLPRAQRR
jgi:hypothetical protein